MLVPCFLPTCCMLFSPCMQSAMSFSCPELLQRPDCNLCWRNGGQHFTASPHNSCIILYVTFSPLPHQSKPATENRFLLFKGVVIPSDLIMNQTAAAWSGSSQAEQFLLFDTSDLIWTLSHHGAGYPQQWAQPKQLGFNPFTQCQQDQSRTDHIYS